MNNSEKEVNFIINLGILFFSVWAVIITTIRNPIPITILITFSILVSSGILSLFILSNRIKQKKIRIAGNLIFFISTMVFPLLMLFDSSVIIDKGSVLGVILTCSLILNGIVLIIKFAKAKKIELFD